MEGGDGESQTAAFNARVPPISVIRPLGVSQVPGAFCVNKEGSLALLACKSNIYLHNLERQSNSIKASASRKHSPFEVSVGHFSPVDDSYFAVAANLGLDLYRVRESSMSLLSSNRHAHDRYINDLDWHKADPHLFVTGSRDDEMRFWDTRSASIAASAARHRGHYTSISQIKWNRRCAHHLLAVSQGTDVRLWDYRNLNQAYMEITAVQTTNIHTLDWSPVENVLLVSGNDDFAVKLFDFTDSFGEDGEKKYITKPPVFAKNPVLKTRFAPFSKSFVLSDKQDPVLRLYGYDEAVCRDEYALQSFATEGGLVLDFVWNSHNNVYRLIALTADNCIRTWLPPPELLAKLNVEQMADTHEYPDIVGHGDHSPIAEPEKFTPGIATPSSEEQSLADSAILEYAPYQLPVYPQPVQKSKYSSPGRKVDVVLESFREEELKVTGVRFKSLNHTYKVTASIVITKNGNDKNGGGAYDVTCEIETLKQTEQSIMDRIKSRMVSTIQSLLASQNNHLLDEVDVYSAESQILAVGVADALLSVCVFIDNDPNLQHEPNSNKTPFPKTSCARFSGCKLVFFSHNAPQQQAKMSVAEVSRGGGGGGGRARSMKEWKRPPRRAQLLHNAIPRIISQDVSEVLTPDFSLAREYRVGGRRGDTRHAVCLHNASVCLAHNRPHIAKTWNVLSVLAKSRDNQLDDDDAVPLSVFPFGRPLVEKMIDHYVYHGDIQTAALVVAVFQELPEDGKEDSTGELSPGTLERSSTYSQFSPARHHRDKWLYIGGGDATSDDDWINSPPIESPDDARMYYALQRRSVNLELSPLRQPPRARPETILDPRKQTRYDLYKHIYAQTLYQWGLFLQRCELLKTRVTQLPSQWGPPSVRDTALAAAAAGYQRSSRTSRSGSQPDDLPAAAEVHDDQFCKAVFRASSPRINENSPSIGHEPISDFMNGRHSLRAASGLDWWVDSSSSKLDFTCALCRRRVVGLFMSCFKCGHGGHVHHLSGWFASHAFCATCGQDCLCSQTLITNWS